MRHSRRLRPLDVLLTVLGATTAWACAEGPKGSPATSPDAPDTSDGSGTAGGSGGSGGSDDSGASNGTSAGQGPAGSSSSAVRVEHLCKESGGDDVRCLASVVVSPFETQGGPNGGLMPKDIQQAYHIPPEGGAGVTVATVVAYDDPNAESDLAVYRRQFGLPECTTANGCFRKVNGRGEAGAYPAPNAAWAGETSLDLDAISAACPHCKILLVEVDDSSSASAFAEGVDKAVWIGAKAVSNSYGTPEKNIKFSFWQWLAGRGADHEPEVLSSHYNQPGVTITAGAGDVGYGVYFPASSPNVIAVGGTTLERDGASARGWKESVWGPMATVGGATGSGCSELFTKPVWQHDPGCDHRTVADVSALADPSTSGLAVYDSFEIPGTLAPGWNVAGGTSLASPLVAAAMAAGGLAGKDASYFYANTPLFHDVTTGNDGDCGTPELCRALEGYDGPTGLGTPNIDPGQAPPAHTACYADTLGMDVENDACVQSKFDKKWYQCADGVWVDRWSDPDYCSSLWALPP